MAISKNRIKFIKSLHRKKFRQKYDNFILEGDKMARELLDAPDYRISGLYALEEWLEEQPGLKALGPDLVFSVSPADLQEISALSTPNKVLATVEIPHPAFDAQWLLHRWTFYLDDIQDPGNMGAILRIADWFGLPWVCGSAGCVDVYNPKVVQASMGSILRTRFATLDLGALKAALPGLPVQGADMNGASIFKYKMENKGLIVIGNEGQGISDNAKTYIDRYFSIPRGAGSRAESLNAAVSAGIIAAFMLRGV